MITDDLYFELDCDMNIPHIHEEMEILFVLSGRVAVMTENTNFVVQTEGIEVFNCFQNHELYREQGAHTLSVYIPFYILNQVHLGKVLCSSTRQPEQEDYFRLIRIKLAAIYQEFCLDSGKRRFYILGDLFELLGILHHKFTVEEEMISIKGEKKKWIQDVLIFLSKHYKEDISLKQAAERFFVSPSHLSREFLKYTGNSFSEYLRKIRLQTAVKLLCHTDKSIIEISGESGFEGINTMREIFKKEYGCTPGEYRKRHLDSMKEIHMDENEELPPLARLYRYQLYNDRMQPLNKALKEPVMITVDLQGKKEKIELSYRKMVWGGWAKDMMMEPVRQAIRRIHEEVGIEFLVFHGLLDDSLNVYHEDADGNIHINFIYIDIILDFICSLGMRPLLEFSYTPMDLAKNRNDRFGNSNNSLPRDLKKWCFLVEGLMKHLIERYGEKETENWKYCSIPAVYVYYGLFSLTEYERFHEATFQSVKKYLPKACFSGFNMDTGIVTLEGENSLISILDFCRKHNCLPDEIVFQCFSCDYSKTDPKEAEKKFVGEMIEWIHEPVPVSQDENNLQTEMQKIHHMLTEHGYGDIPVGIAQFNATIWQRDLGNDTVYNAAFFIKNAVENRKYLHYLSWANITDYSEKLFMNLGEYHGGHGLFTYHMLPKAVYHAYGLLNQIQELLVCEGKGFLVSCSRDYKTICILLYHYCHHNMETRIHHQLPVDEQRTYDRYYGFLEEGSQVFHITLKNMREGIYDSEMRVINREQGSSFDKWEEMGAPKELSKKQIEYLEKISQPGLFYGKVLSGDSGEIMISEVLMPHEVRMICLKYAKN